MGPGIFPEEAMGVGVPSCVNIKQQLRDSSSLETDLPPAQMAAVPQTQLRGCFMVYSYRMQPHLPGCDDVRSSVHACEGVEQSEALIVSRVTTAEEL